MIRTSEADILQVYAHSCAVFVSVRFLEPLKKASVFGLFFYYTQETP